MARLPRLQTQTETDAVTELDPCSRAALARHPPIGGRSGKSAKAAVTGIHCGGGEAISGLSFDGIGVAARSLGSGRAMFASSQTAEAIFAETDSEVTSAVVGISKARRASGITAGVFGTSLIGEGVRGETDFAGTSGVVGVSKAQTPSDGGFTAGVFGTSTVGEGVRGVSTSPTFAAVTGLQESNGPGGFFRSRSGEGVHGETDSAVLSAVVGISLAQTSSDQGFTAGVFGASTVGEGVHGETHSPHFAAIAGIQLNPHGVGAGVYGESRGPGPAGFFKGNVVITGDCSFPGADFAEDFTIAADLSCEPGTVMVMSGNGDLAPCIVPYDRKVVGVVPGAGPLRTGIIMDRHEDADLRRGPVALVGKVYCKVDATGAAIDVGDLLTTSATAGHAMKADPARAFGAVLGKAMAPLAEGRGLIPVLIALQ